MDSEFQWYRVAESNQIAEGDRIHVRVDLRYVTIFRNRGVLSAIDSICHHAGGPLTLGPLKDIEDLGVTVVLCPWHKFMVSIDKGLKAYQSVEIIKGKPQNVGWRLGKTVQRVHRVYEDISGVYVVSCSMWYVFIVDLTFLSVAINTVVSD